MTDDWRITLEELHCVDADEDGGDGDEPMFAVIGFRSRFGISGSTRVWRLPVDGDKWPTGVRSHLFYPIDPAVGAVDFPEVRRMRPGTIDAEVFGVVIVAAERDGSPPSIAAHLMDQAVTVLHGELVRLLENRHLTIFVPQEAQEEVESTIASIAAAVDPPLRSKIAIWAASGADPDDQLGMQLLVFTNFRGLAIPWVRPLAHGSSMLLDFRGRSVHYRLRVRLDRTREEVPTFAPVTFEPQCAPLAYRVIPLPEAVEMVRRGSGADLQFEIELLDGATSRTGFGSQPRHHPGQYHAPSVFVTGGTYGEAISMSAVECRDGRVTTARWKAQILLGRTAVGDPGPHTLHVLINDVDLWYAPLSQNGTVWQGGDGQPRSVQVTSRRRPTLH
ncbi:hypothetical protein [Micromonospora sp. NPDC049891]|uniref:hypothetical protein n=1 Tax=Micromonospora sp. NPDC049891 TaxID=3155655 RepID=UPI0033DF6938